MPPRQDLLTCALLRDILAALVPDLLAEKQSEAEPAAKAAKRSGVGTARAVEQAAVQVLQEAEPHSGAVEQQPENSAQQESAVGSDEHAEQESPEAGLDGEGPREDQAEGSQQGEDGDDDDDEKKEEESTKELSTTASREAEQSGAGESGLAEDVAQRTPKPKRKAPDMAQCAGTASAEKRTRAVPIVIRRCLELITLFAHSPSLSSHVSFEPEFLPSLRFQYSGAYTWIAFPVSELWEALSLLSPILPAKPNMLEALVSCAAGFDVTTMEMLRKKGKGTGICKGVVLPKQVLYIPAGWVLAVSTRFCETSGSFSTSSTSTYNAASVGFHVSCLPACGGLEEAELSLLAEKTSADMAGLLSLLK